MRQVYLDFTDVQDATAVALFQSRVKQVDARITDELSDEQVTERLVQVRGIGPWSADMFLMFSLAGIPPFAGFLAKYAVISAAVASGYVWVAVLGVIALSGWGA